MIRGDFHSIHLFSNWFQQFLRHYNKVTYFDNKKNIFLDASVVFSSLPLPNSCKQFHITQLEMLNGIVALKIWVQFQQDKKVNLYCDNMAAVVVIRS